MRFFGRSLLLGIIAALIAVAGFAQDAEVPVSLHPNSRIWLSDTAAIVMDDDQPATFDTIRQAVESVDGHVIIYAPPGIMLVQISDDGVATVAGTAGVRIITKSPLDPTAFDITNHNALLAVNYFNWVVSGHADADMDRPLDASLADITAPTDLISGSSTAQAAALAAGDHPYLGTSVLVNLVFLSGGTQTWNSADESTAYNNTAAAMSWWNSRLLQHFGTARPSTVPFFSIRTYDISISTTPGESTTAGQWANAAMSVECGGTCTWFDSGAQSRGDGTTNVRNWNLVTRQAAGMNDSFTGFLVRGDVTVSGNVAGGYTYGLGGQWWAIGHYVLTNPDFPAHETGHIYWACDEYDDATLAVHPSCAGCGGPRNALNSNADSANSTSCVIPEHRHICIMKTSTNSFSVLGNDIDQEYLKVCPYTRIQINWWSDNSCYNDVNWDVPSRGNTHWEGTYWSDSHAPRMPLVHWSGGPEITRDDGGGNSLDFDFIANPLTGICLTGSSTATRTTDFSARWRRVVLFSAGQYDFHGTGDDSVQIYVDGLELKPSSTTPGNFERIQLSAGYHTVLVDYFQTSGAANLHVDWQLVTTPSCPSPQYIGALGIGGDNDFCISAQPQRMLVATATSGTAPYRIAISRNGGLPVTYDMPFRNFYFTPNIVGGDSHYTLVSMVDANGCPAQIVGSGIDINFDSSTPRINGGFRLNSTSGCGLGLEWDPATSCSGNTIRYTLTKQAVSSGTLTNSTLLTCSSQLSLVDNDVHPNSSLVYTLTAIEGDCVTGTKRKFPTISTNVGACPTSASVVATANISGTFGDPSTLSAHLTGNGSPIANRSIVFELNGVSAGSGVTDTNGDAHSTATLSLNPGTYTGGLTARFVGDDSWYAASASADVVVQPSCFPATIVTQPSGSTINLGATATLSVSVSGTAPIEIDWYTGSSRIGIGTSISVTPTWTTQYYAVVSNACVSTVTRTVTVTVRQPATITWSAPAAITYGTALSATQLNATANVAGTFTYTPAAGTVLAVGTQTLSLSFAPTDTSQYVTTTATQSIVVQRATPTVTWSAPTAITYGTALSATQLNASANVAGTFTYTPAVGTVLGAGTPTLSVTFTPTDTTTYNSVTTTRTLTVNKANPTGSWSAPAAITYGTPLSATQLNGTSDIPGTIVYNPPAGTVLTAGTHTLTATFTPNDIADYNIVSGTVSITVNKATPTISWSPASITYGTALGATHLNATASTAGTFTYSPAAGTVLTAGAQTLTASFTPTDTANYNTASATVSVTVAKATPTITWSAPAAITYGTALSATQLNATASVAGSFTYSPAVGTVLSAGSQTLTATFTPTDTANYTTASGTVSLTVNKATPTVTWSAPAAITYGTALGATQLNATASVAGTFTYTPASGTILGAGDSSLSVSFAPTDSTNYNGASGSVTQHVNKAAQTITWATPAPIQTGSAVSSTQLNATVSVAGPAAAGAITYDVASGTVLSIGDHTITATAAATANYNAATRSVVLRVCDFPTITSQPQGTVIVAGTTVHLTLQATTYDTITWYKIDGTAVGTGSPSLAVTTTTTFYAIVSNSCASVRSANATITVCAPPTITSQPASFTIIQGQTATLSIGVTALTSDQIQGGGQLYIHWYNASGDVSLGSGNDLVTYPSATMTVYAKVGNGCGEVRSANATIGVAIPACGLPSIDSQSSDVTITDGTSTTLSVDVSSWPAWGVSYQWYINGVAQGANGDDVTNGPELDTGILSTNGSEFPVTYRYYVVVTNSCGSVRSNDFVVTVTNTTIGGEP